MAVETATQAYKRNTDQISKQVQELLELLKTHQDDHAADPCNWGLVGDLGRLNENLNEAVESIRYCSKAAARRSA